MFQTLFPPLPEFQGRQVVTLHNQRDFLFFRRHRFVISRLNAQITSIDWYFSRYAFRSLEKVALQEIGPRFTLKLRSIRKGIPAVFNLAEEPKGLEFDVEPNLDEEPIENPDKEEVSSSSETLVKVVPPKQDEYLWKWKVCNIIVPSHEPFSNLNLQPELETTRRTFFL